MRLCVKHRGTVPGRVHALRRGRLLPTSSGSTTIKRGMNKQTVDRGRNDYQEGWSGRVQGLGLQQPPQRSHWELSPLARRSLPPARLLRLPGPW